MNNSISLQQIQKTSNLDADLIYRQYKLNLMADFMPVKYENPNLKKSQIANQLGYSNSTLERYRNDINMLSPYTNNPKNTDKRTKNNSNTNFDNNSHPNPDVKRPQTTSIGLKTTKTNTKSNKKNKNILKAGSVHENVEINEHYGDEILVNNDI